jgi:hypothetical protein
MEKNVLWFDISVNDSGLQQHSVSTAELHHEVLYLLLTEEILVTQHKFLEIPTFAIFHNEVKVVLARNLELYKVHQVWVMRNVFHYINLIGYSGCSFFVLTVNDLDSELLFHFFFIKRSDDMGV